MNQLKKIKLFPQILIYSLIITWLLINFMKASLANIAFNHWLEEFKITARQHGISEATINKILADIVFDKEIIDFDRKQPEFIRTFKSYIENALSQERINQGKVLMNKHKVLLEEVLAKYGIPPQYIIAFWGMETFYGKHYGHKPVLNALATLAYDTRRTDFFKNELINALKMIEDQTIDSEKMIGSWAGAMGHFQFMPSTYRSYAVDADDDGQKDLWNLHDAFHSAGNYLAAIDWKKGEAWGREIKLPKNFDYFLTGKNNLKSINEWQKLGVKSADNSRLPNSELETWILLPAGSKGPAFFVYHNFDIIMKWNRSFFYALAIGLLADNLSGRGKLQKIPSQERKITQSDLVNIQIKLKEKEIYHGEIDGILGSNTKNAIQIFQKQMNIPADGYPADNFLKLLKVDSWSQNGIKNIPIPKIKPQYTVPVSEK